MPKWEAESKLPGNKSCQKTHTKKKIHQKSICITKSFLCIVQSTQSARHVKCSACFLSFCDFSVTQGRMYDVEQCIKRHINKGKVVGSMLKISHFMGCETSSSQHLDVIRAEMLFTYFLVVQNIALSAANHDICSGSCFCKSELWRRTI